MTRLGAVSAASMRRFRLFSLCFFVLALTSGAHSQAIAPSADTMTSSALPTRNYGSYTALFVQTGSANSSSYIQFNLATLPSNATVTKATLKLYVDQVTTAGSFDVYELNSSWNEATMTYNNAPALGSSATGGNPIAFTTASLNQFIIVDITPLVQQWVNGSLPNNGLALAMTTAAGAISFDSKEATLTSHPPELDIDLAGAQGPQGPQGETGATGPQGPQGLTGATGLQGAQGIQGPQGPQGPGGNNGQGFNFRGAFSNGTNYSAYDVVTYGGSTYDATVSIPAGGGTPDQNPNWALMAEVGAQGPQGAQGDQGQNGATGQGFDFMGPFDNNNNYNAYDVVTYGGSTYVATIGIRGGGGSPAQNQNWSLMAQLGDTGQTGAQGPQGATGAQGAQGPTGPMGPQGPQGPGGMGFNFRGPFDNTQNYNQNDVVSYNGSSYVATVAIPAGGGTPDQNSNWSVLAQQGNQGPGGSGFVFLGVWNSTTNYNPNNVVFYNGSSYTTTVPIPAGGNSPDQNPSWQLMAQVGGTGPQGPQGSQGPQGAQGPQGPQGLPGNLNPGSPYYIQVGTTQQTSASFNIDGAGTLGGLLTAAGLNSTTSYQLGGAPILNAASSSQTTFVGLNAGAAITSGTGDTFVGFQAGTAITSGSQNTFVGTGSGQANVTGQTNTFVGAGAGVSSTGNGNIFIGANSGSTITTGTSEILVGNTGGSAGESHTIRIGTEGGGNGQQNATFIAGISGATSPSGINVLINSSGQLGTTTSSRRFKENILDMGSASSKLFQLRPVTFFYKPEYDDGSHLLQYGLIAEEVAKVYPGLVVYDKDGQPQTVRYHLLAPMLLNELQKQHALTEAQQRLIAQQQQQMQRQSGEISTQQQEIRDLQEQNAEFQQRLQRMESLIEQMAHDGR